MDSEPKTKSKPYFIEVYNSKDNSLLNKYKFVLSAQKVDDLKVKISEKLISKDQMNKDTKYSLKDADDYELASDDEVEDVVPDGKVRVYINNLDKQPDNPENKLPPKVDKEDNKPQQQQVQPVVQAPQVNKANL